MLGRSSFVFSLETFHFRLLQVLDVGHQLRLTRTRGIDERAIVGEVVLDPVGLFQVPRDGVLDVENVRLGADEAGHGLAGGHDRESTVFKKIKTLIQLIVKGFMEALLNATGLSFVSGRREKNPLNCTKTMIVLQ